MCDSTSCRVGYWWSDKKSRKLNLTELVQVFRNSGLHLVKIDLEQPLEQQGPFCAIVHKLSEIMVRQMRGDKHALELQSSFQHYFDGHPDTVIIDPLRNVERLLDRSCQYQLVAESELSKRKDVFIPAFVELGTTNASENWDKMKAAGINFPIVCKPSLAHGHVSHQLSLIFNRAGLRDVVPPCVVQQFVNHNALCYKLFVIGDKYFIIERPSLKNFYAGDHKTIFFDSNDISKPHSASALTSMDAVDTPQEAALLDRGRMDEIVRVATERTGLSLLGIDVIVDNGTGSYAIIDINIFPGYWEVDNFYQLLCDLVLSRLESRNQRTSRPRQPTLVNDPQSIVPSRPITEFDFDPKKIEWFTKPEPDKMWMRSGSLMTRGLGVAE